MHRAVIKSNILDAMTVHIRTECKSHVAGWRQDKSNSHDAGQQTARYDQIYYVVKRFALHVKSKHDTSTIAICDERRCISCNHKNTSRYNNLDIEFNSYYHY